MQTQDTQELTTYCEKEVAAMLGVKVTTLQNWRWAGRGPVFVKIGRLVRYTGADLAAWLEKNKQGGAE